MKNLFFCLLFGAQATNASGLSVAEEKLLHLPVGEVLYQRLTEVYLFGENNDLIPEVSGLIPLLAGQEKTVSQIREIIHAAVYNYALRKFYNDEIRNDEKMRVAGKLVSQQVFLTASVDGWFDLGNALIKSKMLKAILKDYPEEEAQLFFE